MIKATRILIVIVTMSIVIAMLTGALQRHLTYYPERAAIEQLEGQARALGFDKWLNEKGEFIGWKSKGTQREDHLPILILHGNAGHALYRTELAENIEAALPGSATYILEYPGYGARSGKPSEPAFLEAAREGLASIPSSTRPLVVGESLGTGVASQLNNSARALLLLTPFDSLTSAAKHHYPYLPVGLLMADRYDSASSLKESTIPLAVVVGQQDRITPAKMGERLIEAHKGPKRLWSFAGVGHDVPYRLSKKDWREILEWLAGQAGEPPQR